MEKNILLEGLRTRKPPEEFQDVCLKTFCAVTATLQLEDFNVGCRSYTQAICCAQGFSLSELAFVPPFSGIMNFHGETYIFLCHVSCVNIKSERHPTSDSQQDSKMPSDLQVKPWTKSESMEAFRDILC